LNWRASEYDFASSPLSRLPRHYAWIVGEQAIENLHSVAVVHREDLAILDRALHGPTVGLN
jgi:hypothetical protein